MYLNIAVLSSWFQWYAEVRHQFWFLFLCRWFPLCSKGFQNIFFFFSFFFVFPVLLFLQILLFSAFWDFTNIGLSVLIFPSFSSLATMKTFHLNLFTFLILENICTAPFLLLSDLLPGCWYFSSPHFYLAFLMYRFFIVPSLFINIHIWNIYDIIF